MDPILPYHSSTPSPYWPPLITTAKADALSPLPFMQVMMMHGTTKASPDSPLSQRPPPLQSHGNIQRLNPCHIFTTWPQSHHTSCIKPLNLARFNHTRPRAVTQINSNQFTFQGTQHTTSHHHCSQCPRRRSLFVLRPPQLQFRRKPYVQPILHYRLGTSSLRTTCIHTLIPKPCFYNPINHTR